MVEDWSTLVDVVVVSLQARQLAKSKAERIKTYFVLVKDFLVVVRVVEIEVANGVKVLV
jgi:hypothetical protein